MEIWKILKIEETKDEIKIKEAYREAVKDCHPEEKPQEFVALQKAYKAALEFAKNGNVKKESISKSSTKIKDVMKNDVEDDIKDDAKNKKNGALLKKLEDEEQKRIQESKNSPAMKEFKRLFEDKSTAEDYNSWRAYFDSEIFWKEMYNISFTENLLEYLKNQSIYSFDKLPKELVGELAVCYSPGLFHRDMRITFEKEAEEPGNKRYMCNMVWKSNENLEENIKYVFKRSNVTRIRAYGCFENLYDNAINNTWEKLSVWGDDPEYTYDMSMGREVFMMTDEEADKSKISMIDLEDDHINIVFLPMVNFLLRNFEIPVSVCSYVYKEFKLTNIDKSNYADLYGPIKEIILEKYPQIESYTAKKKKTPSEYIKELRKQINEIHDKYYYNDWGWNYTDRSNKSEEELRKDELADYEEFKKLFETPEFKEYKFCKEVIEHFYIFSATGMEAAAILEEYTKDNCWDKKGVVRLLLEAKSIYQKNRRKKEYMCNTDYDYNLSMECADFWYYYLSVAFGDRFVVSERGNIPLPPICMFGPFVSMYSIVNNVTPPSEEWVEKFTNYNITTGQVESACYMNIQLSDNLAFKIEFHMHYVKLFLNDKEVLEPVLSITQLNEMIPENGALIFILLLPFCYVGKENADELEMEKIESSAQRIYDILADIFQDEIVADFLVNQIMNENVASYTKANIVSRKYLENPDTCYRLDTDSDGVKYIWKFNDTIGIYENMDKNDNEKHYRSTIIFDEEAKEEGFDMEAFDENTIKLPYESDKEVYDVSELSSEDKTKKLIELADKNDELVLAYGEQDRSTLRFKFYLHDITDPEKYKEEHSRKKYLYQYSERLNLLLDSKSKKMYSLCFIGLSDCVIAQDESDRWVAKFTHNDDFDESADSLDEMIAKLIRAENVTHIITFEKEYRSEWN